MRERQSPPDDRAPPRQLRRRQECDEDEPNSYMVGFSSYRPPDYEPDERCWD